MPVPPKKIKVMKNTQHGKKLGKGSGKSTKNTGSGKSGGAY